MSGQYLESKQITLLLPEVILLDEQEILWFYGGNALEEMLSASSDPLGWKQIFGHHILARLDLERHGK